MTIGMVVCFVSTKTAQTNVNICRVVFIKEIFYSELHLHL